ncbi:MAG: type II toxin-antitoxin system ParD family antitoxin [Patescibacteria group bacterium]
MAHPAAQMSISLPRDIKAYVKRRAKEAHYGTPSDYMRGLVREDMRRAELERLEQALVAGLESGRGVAYGAKEWRAFREALMRNIAGKKRGRL